MKLFQVQVDLFDDQNHVDYYIMEVKAETEEEAHNLALARVKRIRTGKPERTLVVSTKKGAFPYPAAD
jgi:hypothetical protein